MKILKILTPFLFLLFLSATVFSQADSTIYKIKIDQYQSWQKTGKILTISGAAVVAVGAGLRIYATTYADKGKSDDTIVGASYAIIGVGVATIVNGLIFGGIGKRKSNDYQIKLDDLRTSFYYTPKHSGVVFTYRF